MTKLTIYNNRHKATRSWLTRMVVAVALTMATATAGAQVFAHYKGHANSALGANGMQSVSEIHYYYYVDNARSPINLLLPLQNYAAGGHNCEPHSYFRWYSYSTDMASPYLKAVGARIQAISDAQGKARGLFALRVPDNVNPSHSQIGVTYNPPANASDASWQGDTIACDISRYYDWCGKGGSTFTGEPTLSYRCIFHILPGRKMAEEIVNTTSTDIGGKYSDLTIEDNKRIVFGAKDANARIMLRTNMPQNRYYFYALTNTKHHVYSADEAHKITSADFDRSKLYASDGIFWRAYDKTKTKYTDVFSWYVQLPTTGFGMNLIQNNGNGWRTLDGASTTKPTIGYGDVVYLVAFARSGKSGPYAPVANYEILFQNTYPKSRAQIMADGDTERFVEYLDSHYQQAMKPITFDDDNEDMDLTAPTTPDNNTTHIPSKWDKRSYGFTYSELKDFAPSTTGGIQPYTPIHGEYGLYKSANLTNVSTSSQGYRWWTTSPTTYDRTYERTGGKQYGYFLYIDASDESRQIAAADFKANLCSGAKLRFSGAVANYTAVPSSAIDPIRPQVMFRLYGVIRDDNDSITDQRLITSFSSGDFKTNTVNPDNGVWMQVYAKVVLPRNTGVENYSDFRIVMDNMCYNTTGADYLIDDLRLYIQPAKVDVAQNMPVCPDEVGYTELPTHITLKLRASYENMLTMVGNKASHLFYRICNADGTPVSTIDYDGDGQPDSYGTAEVPATYDKLKMLPAAAADGKTNVPMFELNPQNDVLLIFANRYFDLPMGKQYYVSVAYPDDTDEDVPGQWGTPTNVCSTYSEEFEIVKQGIIITDANGNIVTNVRVSCDEQRTPNVNINAKLETADIVNGGKITLNSVRFDWFLGRPNEPNMFQQITGLQEALARYRATYPEATGLQDSYQATDPTGYALLKQYVDSGQLVIAASNNLNGYKFGKDMLGLIRIAAIPIASKITEGSTTYEICPDPMFFNLRIVEDGPKLTMGFDNVIYPNDSRTVRIGLPQIRAMIAKGKELVLPVTSLESSKSIVFENNSDVFISDTNDPTWDATKQIIAIVKNDALSTDDRQLSIVFENNATDILHEGYWYEFNFSFKQNRTGTETVVSCPGETFITFKIVPEYLTWNSTSANKLNANWNNDLNWLRSTAAQLYKPDYTDYGTASDDSYSNNVLTSLTRQQAYVPMKFSKVTVVDMTGRTYPSLDNVAYRAANHIATKLTNNKGENATADIQYDMEVKWNYLTADHSDNGDGVFGCETFQGNVCDQIYLKPHAELLGPCYLVYNRAYVEKEMQPGKWYIASSPLRDTYAGDMYAPKDNGRQTTEAFVPISFDPSVYSRTAYPFYQRVWDGHASEVADSHTSYEAYGYDGTLLRIDTISDNSINIESLYWSHVYNKMDEPYASGKAFAIKTGDGYTLAAGAPCTLLRLPKADTAYSYYDYDGTATDTKASVSKDNAYRMLVEASTEAGNYSPLYQQLPDNVHSGDVFYMLGNPYTATLSMRQFLKGNTEFAPKVWTLEGGKAEAHVVDLEAGNDPLTDVMVEPMQAFFVKLADGQDKPTGAYFTTAMTVDRWLNGGTGQNNMAPELTITASTTDGTWQSVARVVIDSEATSDYDDTKDAEMLCNTSTDDVPQVFTAAGHEAVALNNVRSLEWLPVGVVADSTTEVSITFAPNRRLNTQLWLFDAKQGVFSPIEAGRPMRVQAAQYGRYYITTYSSADFSAQPTATISCYAIGGGRVAVSSASGTLTIADIYSADGTLLQSNRNINATSCVVTTTPGMRIVKAAADDGATRCFKLVVK